VITVDRPAVFPGRAFWAARWVGACSQGEGDGMTFNICLGVAKDVGNVWEHRRELVCDVLRNRTTDVVGLQEAWGFQIEAICEAVPGHGWVGRSRDEAASKSEWCAISS